MLLGGKVLDIHKAGVPKVHFHVLRHTHAINLLAKDVNVKIISERLKVIETSKSH